MGCLIIVRRHYHMLSQINTRIVALWKMPFSGVLVLVLFSISFVIAVAIYLVLPVMSLGIPTVASDIGSSRFRGVATTCSIR